MQVNSSKVKKFAWASREQYLILFTGNACIKWSEGYSVMFECFVDPND